MPNIPAFLFTFALLMFSMVFDWLAQTDWEATNKFTNPLARAIHSAVYAILTVLFLAVFQYYKVSYLIIIGIVLFVTHFIIDSRKLVIKIRYTPDQMENIRPHGGCRLLSISGFIL